MLKVLTLTLKPVVSCCWTSALRALSYRFREKCPNEQHCIVTAHLLPANFLQVHMDTRTDSNQNPDCPCRCRLGNNASFLLDSTVMNVRVPAVDDVANSLPPGWKKGKSALPDQAWLEQFWATAARQQWHPVPPALTGFYLLPLVGGKLDTLSPKHVLTAAHLSSLSLGAASEQPAEAINAAAEVLTAVGCGCISEPRANIVSSIPADEEPITFALAAVARKLSMSVHQLVSLQHLGANTFTALCHILAKLHIRDTDRLVKTVLRQCTVYEDTTGTLVALDKR